jgi:Carboxypeptidase regulatory-like domain
LSGTVSQIETVPYTFSSLLCGRAGWNLFGQRQTLCLDAFFGASMNSLVSTITCAVGLFVVSSRGIDDPTPSEDSGKICTITGVCQDETGKPLAGVLATLYRHDRTGSDPEPLGKLTTSDDGRFRFAQLAPMPTGPPAWTYFIACTKKGRGSIVQPFFESSFSDGVLRDPCELRFRPAATLDGRVTDSNGKPVAGARVWAHGGFGPLDGVKTARTDADGRFAINDMGATDPDKLKPRDVGNGIQQVFGHSYFDVLHPDYGHG